MGDAHHCSGLPVSEMTYTVSSGTLNSTIPYNTIPPTTQKKPRIREDRQNFMFHRPAQPQSALKSTHTEAVHHQEVLLGSSILVFVHEGSWSHLGQTVINPLLSADISSPPTSREDRSIMWDAFDGDVATASIQCFDIVGWATGKGIRPVKSWVLDCWWYDLIGALQIS